MDSGRCGCGERTAGTGESIEAVNERVRDLTELVAEYMGDASSDRAGRNRRAERAAQHLLRIIGGEKVEPGTYPECCLIGNVRGGGWLREWFCTGTLIHPRVVVTARHCIGSTTLSKLDPNSVALGVDKEGDVKPGSSELIRVARIVRHPVDDIALLILRKSSAIAPVARASQEETAAADRVHLVGFGNSNPGGTMGFGIKREVNVEMNVVRKSPSEDLSDAEAALGFNSFTELVAGRKGSGKDSCNGDSGGPAYVVVDGDRKLAGATSRATDEAMDNCGDGGVYVRLDAVADWIEDTIDRYLS